MTEKTDNEIDDTATELSAPGSESQLILAARLYYIDGLSQAQIAKMTGVSQAKVSRLLSVARDRGIVRISVPEYDSRDARLEQLLLDRYRLKNVIVVRRLESQSPQEVRNTIGYFAGPIVSAWIKPSTTVALAGGRTVRCLVERMQPSEPTSGVIVAQAMGNIDESPGTYDALDIGRIIAKRWGGSFLTLNTPAFLPDSQVCEQFLALDQVRKVFLRLAQADLAFVGVGNLENSVFVDRKVLKPKDIAQLRNAGAVGEILGRFYDRAGKECDTPYRNRVISLGLDQLRGIAQVVGVVAGRERVEAIRGAIVGGLLKSVVVDDAAAEALCE